MKYLEHKQAIKSIVPETGAFEGWKRLRHNRIARLLIPASAKRIGGHDILHPRKCRASSAKVLAIFSLVTGGRPKTGISIQDRLFEYRVGKTVRPRFGFSDNLEACAGGIHFFLTRVEAETFKY